MRAESLPLVGEIDILREASLRGESSAQDLMGGGVGGAVRFGSKVSQRVAAPGDEQQPQLLT